jgi:hypothetical protein
MPKFVCMIGLWMALAGAAPGLHATVLEQLTLAEMSQQSTSIVRAKVTGVSAALKGSDAYTLYQLQIWETWKRGALTPNAVAVPGGVAGGIRQVVPGAPALQPGAEYVLFLWTGRSGLTQIIGLSQGVFRIAGENGRPIETQRDAKPNVKLDPQVTRIGSQERMVDRQGKDVRSADEIWKLSALRRQVQDALANRSSVVHQIVVAQRGAK